MNSLKEKIGQMIIMGFKGAALYPNDDIVKAIQHRQVGGVILFDYNYHKKNYEHNIQSVEQLKALTQTLQYYNRANQELGSVVNNTNKNFAQKNNLPLLIGIDYEGGEVNRLKENYGFPKTLSAAAISQLPIHEAEAYVATMASTLKDCGINLNFAPVVDLNINPNNPIIGKKQRSFSVNAKKVVEMAKLFTNHFQRQKIFCTYKHFPGHGSSLHDSHQGFVDVTKTWHKEELKPYQMLLADATRHQLVMTAHVVHRGLDSSAFPASLSYAITQQLLRNQLHFNGVVVTDDLQMKAITQHYPLPEALKLAINAGADLLVFGNQLVQETQSPQEIIDIIADQVQRGDIPASRIDASYQRIAHLKQGLIY